MECHQLDWLVNLKRDMTLGKKAKFGRMETLEPSPAKRVHDECTDIACNSPTCLTDNTDH